MESIYQKRKKKVQLPWALFQPLEKNMKQKCLWLVCRNNTLNVALTKFGGLIYFSSSKLRRYCKDFDTAFFARAFPAHWWRIRFLSDCLSPAQPPHLPETCSSSDDTEPRAGSPVQCGVTHMPVLARHQITACSSPCVYPFPFQQAQKLIPNNVGCPWKTRKYDIDGRN